MKNIHLLAIDCQQDFCNAAMGSLYVEGATWDMINLAKLIDRLSGNIRNIHATLDEHRVVDISHPIMHISKDGKHPNPFTTITEEDYKNGTWKCTNPKWQERVANYIHQLKIKGKYNLTVWPEHCIIASLGGSLLSCISNAFIKWERDNFSLVDYIGKGSNPFVEAYGAIEAEVVDPLDPGTMRNTSLLNVLAEADELLIAGEALSHCVSITCKQIVSALGDEFAKKLVLLKDCTSSVTGCDNLGDNFVKEMSAKGMRVTTSVDYLA